jgi:hypothetical protein
MLEWVSWSSSRDGGNEAARSSPSRSRTSAMKTVMTTLRPGSGAAGLRLLIVRKRVLRKWWSS